jgi:excisionase family DNA binding protein
MDCKSEQLMTVEEVAEILRCKTRTIYNYIEAGWFDVVRCSRKSVRIKKSSFDKFVEHGGVKQ